MNKLELHQLIKEEIQKILKEGMSFEEAKEKALNISKEEGVAQHVNQITDTKFVISDWYDADTTVFSCEDGRELQ